MVFAVQSRTEVTVTLRIKFEPAHYNRANEKGGRTRSRSRGRRCYAVPWPQITALFNE
jgi:hypothetical protein